MSSARLARVVAGLALASTLVTACVRQNIPVSSSVATGVAPQLTVESFLRAANCVASARCANKPQEIQTMGRLFGTKDGPLLDRDPRTEVEQRMFALASLLESQDYHVQGQNIVPGRVGEAVQLLVDLVQRDRTVRVPITVVHARGGEWLVEEIDTKALTQTR